MAHQLNTKKDAAVVIGGVNMDIWGRPDGALVMRDSTPGTVRMTPGGVGRNIAHDLRLLGMDVAFVTAMGDDLVGQALMASCTELGFDMQHALVKKGGHSSTYLFVTEAGGDMCAAINDMDICSQLTPSFFESLLPKLRDRIVAMPNLSFYCWATSLSITTGITVKNIVHSEATILLLLAIAAASATFLATNSRSSFLRLETTLSSPSSSSVLLTSSTDVASHASCTASMRFIRSSLLC